MTSTGKPPTKVEKRGLRCLKRIGDMIERGLREDVIILNLHCKVEDIFEARKLLNREATPETVEKSRLDTLVILESRGQLSEFHLYAAEEIYTARKLKSLDVRCRIASLETRVDTKGNRPSGTESEYVIRIQQQYNRWWINCFNSGVDLNACIYMIENQATLREADKHFGRRRGYTKTHLVLGLGKYCSLFRPVRKN